jgi:hypothetical protein
MKKYRILVVVAVLTAWMPAMLQAQPRSPEPVLDTLMNHVRSLSSSYYEGRLAGTDAYMQSALYCQQAFARYGVQPYQGDWQQLFQVECNEIENATFKSYVTQNDTRKVYVLGKEFSCAGMTGRGYADANVVFLGYGVDDPTYDEYAKVDARGKIALVLSGVPDWLPSTVTDKYATVRDKARVAQKHGCCALVVINMNDKCAANEVQCFAYSGEQPHLATFPIIQPTRACGAMLFAGERMSLDSVMGLLQSNWKPQSFHLSKKFEIEVDARYHPAAISCNVVGIYPGTNKNMSNEYIVVGAALDGVGIQGRTCMYPGADVNASGVAALLETARMLKQAEEQPERSVIFVLLGAEEQRNLSSRIFVSNFSPLKRIEAFVDVSNLGGGESVAVLGNNKYPGLWDVADKMDSTYCHVMQHGVKTNPKGAAIAFDSIGIPSINITNVNGNRHNHVPSDIAENIDRRYLVNATRLVFQTVYELSFGDYQGRTQLSRRYRFK